MVNRSKIIYSVATIFMVGLIFSTIVHAETITQDTPIVIIPTPQLFDKDIFGENEQSSAMIRPRFLDGSTNIIFYIDYGNNNFQYAAETSAHYDLPFSDYYAPAPGVGKYIAVEYRNDAGTFGCSGISLNECITDPHFISQFSFEIRDDVIVVPEVAEENATTTSIMSDLSDGQTATAPIDGVVVTETSTTTETETASSQMAAVSEADTGILDAVIETFLDIIGVDDAVEATPTSEAPTDSAVEETPTTSSVTGDTNTNGTTTTTF